MSQQPRYMISYRWIADNGMAGNGNYNSFMPRLNGEPSVLTPEHIDAFIKNAAEETQRTIPYVTEITVIILSVWRWETDAEV